MFNVNRNPFHRCVAFCLVVAASVGAALAVEPSTKQASGCAALTDAEKTNLVSYVVTQYRIPANITVTLPNEETADADCFKRLTFEGKSKFKNWTLVLFLSPDRHHLTSDLLDLSLDPLVEKNRRTAQLMTSLSENRGTSLGPQDAPVTIIEFSDFQCPYCRRFSGILRDVLKTDKPNVRVVFHHLPLSMHAWARRAAEGAACAQLQTADAFWQMEDKIFSAQDKINPENVDEKLLEFANGIQSLDQKQFKSCLSDDLSLGIVLRDIKLAADNHIDATPTILLNGRTIEGIKDAGELRSFLTEAKIRLQSGESMTATQSLDNQTRNTKSISAR